MRREGRVLGTLMAAVALAVLASPAAAGGKPSFAGPGAGASQGNAGGAVRGVERAMQKASPQGQQGIQKAQDAINKAATKNLDNTNVEQHNPNVDLTASPPPEE